MAKTRFTYIKDGAYYGSNEMLDWFVDRANRDTNSMRVLTAQGACDPVQIPAKIEITKVTLDQIEPSS